MKSFKTTLLTREEVESAILAAKRQKYSDAGYDTVSKRELVERIFWERIKIEVQNFIITDDNEKVLEKLFKYFSGDKSIESEDISLSKGIILTGPVGCGKTSIMRAFRETFAESNFGMMSCRDIVQNYFDPKAYDLGISFYKNLGKKGIGFCFDDLGVEEVVTSYGNRVDVMAEIISTRYDRVPRNKTHFTTNLSASYIGDTYGDRIRSRLGEMVNLIAFDPKAKDMRS